MKKTILIIIGALLLLAVGYQTAVIVNRHSATETPEETLDEPEDLEAYISNIYEGMEIDADSTFVSDYKGTPVALSDMAGPRQVIARISTEGCRPCIDALLTSLRDFSVSNPDWRINVIIKGAPLRDLFVFGKEYGNRFRFYSADRLPTDYEDASAPTVFMIENGHVKHHFTCRYGDEQRTKDYVTKLNEL